MINTKKIILAGGGDAPESYKVDKYFSSLLVKKKMLFFPQAVSPEIWSYADALNWIKTPTAFQEISITMCLDMSNIDIKKLLEYDAIYLMGGNTYKLLNFIRESKLDNLMLEYLDMGGIIYGISAGAIVLGLNITTAGIGPEKDENFINLTDLNGLNILNGIIVATHYSPEMNNELLKLSYENNAKIIGIPESSGIYLENRISKVLGFEAITIFDNGNMQSFAEGSSFLL